MLLGVTLGVDVVLVVPPFVAKGINRSLVALLVEVCDRQGLLILRRLGILLQIDTVFELRAVVSANRLAVDQERVLSRR